MLTENRGVIILLALLYVSTRMPVEANQIAKPWYEVTLSAERKIKEEFHCWTNLHET